MTCRAQHSSLRQLSRIVPTTISTTLWPHARWPRHMADAVARSYNGGLGAVRPVGHTNDTIHFRAKTVVGSHLGQVGFSGDCNLNLESRDYFCTIIRNTDICTWLCVYHSRNSVTNSIQSATIWHLNCDVFMRAIQVLNVYDSTTTEL